MRKMVLVPEEYVDELKRLRQHYAQLPAKPEVVQTLETQTKMNDILGNPNLSANEKKSGFPGESSQSYTDDEEEPPPKKKPGKIKWAAY